MTQEERIIATAYTGVSFLDNEEIDALCKYASDKLGYDVEIRELLNKSFWILLKDRSREEFIKMVFRETGEQK